MVDYVFKSYDPQFPQLFEAEKKRLEQFLTTEDIIEHFGSTAVPGLGGKGIVDIYILTQSDRLQRVFQGLEQVGYEARPNAGSPTRFVYVREIVHDGEKERYHIHVSANREEYEKDILFRDWLREHPEDKEKYALIKQKAAKEANQSKDEYMKIKSPIIQEILAKALKAHR